MSGEQDDGVELQSVVVSRQARPGHWERRANAWQLGSCSVRWTLHYSVYALMTGVGEKTGALVAWESQGRMNWVALELNCA